MKKLSDIEAKKLFAKAAAGEKLIDEEVIALFVFNGLSEEKAKEAMVVTSPEYGKPDKDDIIAVV